MIISLQRPHLSLVDLPQTELPAFTIITGVNGAGKTHLLKALQVGAAVADIAPAVQSDIRSFDWTNLAPREEAELDGASLRAEQLQIYTQVSQLMQNPWGAQQILTIARNLGLRGPKATDLDILCNDSAAELETRFGLNSGQGSTVRSNLDQVVSQTTQNILNSVPPPQQALLKELERDTEKKFISLKYDDFVRASKPTWGEAEIFQQSFARLFVSYRELYQTNGLQELAFNSGDTKVPPLSAAEFDEKYGSRPWDFVNSALAAAGLTFTIDAPAIYSRAPYKPRLRKGGLDAEITFDGLSSGERVIMSFAFAVYYASDRRQLISRPKLLLLDEVDAPLHPSMCRNLLATIEDVLVKQHGLSVIMTTHSPSTVALAPEEAVHVMRPGEPGIHKVSRDVALRDLTAGVPTLSLKNDGRRQVFVESPKDVSIYEAAYSVTKDVVASELSPNFIATGATSPIGHHTNTGCDTVRRIVQDLRAAGAEHTIGLLDWDGRNSPSPGMFILAEGKRNGLESIFFDPLLLLSAVARHVGLNAIACPWPTGATYLTIRELTTQQLQVAIDAVQASVLGHTREASVDVDYIGGFKLEVDQAYLTMDDHALEQLVMTAFPTFNAISRNRAGELMKWIATTIIPERKEHVPTCLIETFSNLVSS